MKLSCSLINTNNIFPTELSVKNFELILKSKIISAVLCIEQPQREI